MATIAVSAQRPILRGQDRAPRPREHGEHGGGDERERGRDQQEAREVGSSGAVPARVHDMHRGAHCRQRDEDESEQPACDRRQARVDDRHADDTAASASTDR